MERLWRSYALMCGQGRHPTDPRADFERGDGRGSRKPSACPERLPLGRPRTLCLLLPPPAAAAGRVLQPPLLPLLPLIVLLVLVPTAG